MHSKSIRRALLLTALAVLAPGVARAQAQSQYAEDYAPPDTVWPFPLYSTHPESGGLYTALQFISYTSTNPLQGQVVARRGLTLVDPALAPVPTFQGSNQIAMDVSEVSGPNDFQPGVAATVGWKFGDGSAFEVKYVYITEVNLHNSATEVPPQYAVGQNFENSFLFSPVFGFPNDYNGPAQKIATDPVGGPSSVPGIWNGASIMTEQFLQRKVQAEATWRTPIIDDENYRMNALVGPRFTWFWERYKWTASDIDVNTGLGGPQFTADYSNIVSNRMYGIHAGCQNEYYIGHGFATQCDLQAAIYADSVKTDVMYSLARGAVGPGSKRARHLWTIAPELQATLGLMWYPIEGVQVHAGYDFQVFFNTVSSHQPIDFNYGAVDPRFETDTIRLLDGLDLGIAFIF